MILDKKLSGILDEISNYVPNQTKDLMVENRARQVIASAKHLVELIETLYDEPVASDLKRRLFNSIKSGDEKKFCRKTKALREGKVTS